MLKKKKKKDLNSLKNMKKGIIVFLLIVQIFIGWFTPFSSAVLPSLHSNLCPPVLCLFSSYEHT